MLSTVHRNSGSDRVNPKVVVDYSIGKKGVDTSDQLAVPYPSTRKSLKWYKVLFNLLNMTVVNAFAVQKVLRGHMTQLTFQKTLAEGLMRQRSRRGREVRWGEVRSRSRSQSRSHSPPITPPLQGIHCQICMPHRRYHRCWLCYSRGVRRITKVIYSGCDVPLSGFLLWGISHSEHIYI